MSEEAAAICGQRSRDGDSIQRSRVMEMIEQEIGQWADGDPPRHVLSALWGKVRDMAIARQPAGWRLMNTAPMDGTPVDLWTDYGRQTNCRFTHHEWLNGKPVAPKAWFRRSTDGPMPTPTHWMPPPEPPMNNPQMQTYTTLAEPEPLTAHALARLLLQLPDLPVVAQNSGIKFRLVRAYVLEETDWAEREKPWTENEPAVIVADHTDNDWMEAWDAQRPRR